MEATTTTNTNTATTTMDARTPRRLVVGLALVALISRVAAILWLRTFHGDAGAYEHDLIARALVGGDGFSFAFFSDRPEPTGHQAPAMPFVLAVGYWLLGVGSAGGRLFAELVNAVLAAAAAGALGVMAFRWWGQRAMVVAMAGFVAYPALAYMATRIQAVNWTVAFLLMMLAAFVVLRPQDRRAAVATGAIAALGALAEPILAAPFGLCWLWWTWRARPDWRTPALVATSYVLVLAPWLTRNAVMLGHAGFVKSSFGYVAWQGNHVGATGTDKLAVAPDVQRVLAWRVGGRDLEALLDTARAQAVSVDVALSAADSAALRALPTERARMEWFRSRLRAELAAEPMAYGRAVAKRAAMLAWFDPTNPRSFLMAYRVPYLVLLALAVLGFVRLRRDGAWPVGFGLWCASLAGLAAVFVLVIASARFRLPMEALLLLPAAYGVAGRR